MKTATDQITEEETTDVESQTQKAKVSKAKAIFAKIPWFRCGALALLILTTALSVSIPFVIPGHWELYGKIGSVVSCWGVGWAESFRLLKFVFLVFLSTATSSTL